MNGCQVKALAIPRRATAGAGQRLPGFPSDSGVIASAIGLTST